MEFKGQVISVINKSGTSKEGKSFEAYQFVVEEQIKEYPQSAVFDIFGDRVKVPNIGDVVTIQFNMRANEWQGKYFGKNNAWKIEVEASSTPDITPDPLANIAASVPTKTEISDDSDDLPF